MVMLRPRRRALAALQRLRDRVQRPAHRLVQAPSLRGQFHPARAACQQLLAEAFLQLAHAVAQRAHRQVHALGGAGQVAQPRGGDEGLHLVQRNPAHLEPPSSLACGTCATCAASIALA